VISGALAVLSLITALAPDLASVLPNHQSPSLTDCASHQFSFLSSSSFIISLVAAWECPEAQRPLGPGLAYAQPK